MQQKDILKQLKGLKSISPEPSFKNGLRARIVADFKPQENLVFKGNLAFQILARPRLAPVLVPALAVLLIAGVFAFFGFFGPSNPPEIVQPDNPETYLLLIEKKLDEIKEPNDVQEVVQEVVTIFEQASDSISETATANNSEKTAQIARAVADINKKVKQIEQDLGAEAPETKDLKHSAQVLTSRASEALGQDIEQTQKDLVANLIELYEAKSLSDSDLELFNQAKQYYNQEQFELALEKILEIGNNQ